jgi:hypothetical protein
MNQAEKACYEMHLAAFCAPFRIAKGICQLIQIGKATCQIPKAIETAIREGLSSVVASGRGQIEQRAKDSLFWDVVLRTQDVGYILINICYRY